MCYDKSDHNLLNGELIKYKDLGYGYGAYQHRNQVLPSVRECEGQKMHQTLQPQGKRQQSLSLLKPCLCHAEQWHWPRLEANITRDVYRSGGRGLAEKGKHQTPGEKEWKSKLNLFLLHRTLGSYKWKGELLAFIYSNLLTWKGQRNRPRERKNIWLKSHIQYIAESEPNSGLLISRQVP